MKIALMGTRGAPALYGGFETAVEEIGKRLVQRGYEVNVYCRNPGQEITEFEGMHLVNLPAIKHRMAETLSHTALSTAHAITKDRPDVCLLLNAGNAPLLTPLKLAKIPTAIHLDGLESKREKWRGMGARYYTWAEKRAINAAQEVIADAQGIADHVKEKFGRDCWVIPYGAEVLHPGSERLSELNLEQVNYNLLVARIEPENHVFEAVHGYLASENTQPLVIVGSAPYADWYKDKITHVINTNSDRDIRMLGGIYDQDLLNQLYGNASTYLHGHSVGGTNPSLLRAMGCGAPVLAFDCVFNREVTNEAALFWSNAQELAAHLDSIDAGQLARFSRAGRERIAEFYQWEKVTDDYERLIKALARP
jgi:glycosyltransferase involved in cell wall biosynthesis